MDVKKEPLTKEDYSTLQKIETNLNKQRVLFLENHEILKIEEYLECLSELLEKDELSLTIISNIKNIIK